MGSASTTASIAFNSITPGASSTAQTNPVTLRRPKGTRTCCPMPTCPASNSGIR